MRAIAEVVGTTRESIAQEIQRARAVGRNFPLRQRPRKKRLTKAEARWQFSRAVTKGVIRRPSRCEDCGELRRVEGHHEDYGRPLYVIWLCRKCHKAAHGGGFLNLEVAA